MRRVAILMAGAALALGLAIPGMAAATGKTTTSGSLDTPIAAQGKGGHHSGGGHKGSYRKGYRHGYRDGRDDGRHRHGYYGHRGGRCYGCYGPGSDCGRYGCYYYGYPGYYGGGYGCNFDYPCGPNNPRSDCSKKGPDGKPPADSGCKYDQKCDCYYHSSQPPAEAGAQPAPEAGAQPAPDQGEQPPAEGAEPTPPDQGGEQPRPY